jgi:hypothetical protein
VAKGREKIILKKNLEGIRKKGIRYSSVPLAEPCIGMRKGPSLKR